MSDQNLTTVLKDPMPSGFSGWGVVMNYFTNASTIVPAYNLATYTAVKSAHFYLIRFLPDWQTIETTAGVYDFTYPDSLMSQFQTLNLRPIIGLGLNNPLYGVYSRINTDAQRTAFGNFVNAIVTHYKGKHVIWEVWNEPNIPAFWPPAPGETLTSAQAAAEYMQMLNVVVPIIRAADPSALVIAPAAANVDTPWMLSAINQGLLTNLDAVSFHPYQPGNIPEAVIPELNFTKTWFPSNKANIPIFFTESGYSTGIGTNEVSQTVQANYVMRQYLLSMMLGVNVNTNYALADTGESGSDTCTTPDHCYGWFTEYSGTAKPVFTALKSLMAAIYGYKYVGPITQPSSTTYVLEFSNAAGGAIRYVVWDSTTTTGVAVVLPDGSNVTATQTPIVYYNYGMKV